MLFVTKRNHEEVPFDKEKVINAINKAFVEVDGQLYETETAEEIADNIEKGIAHAGTAVPVEEIQDWVEDNLMASDRKDVARAYIRYRYKKEILRQTNKTYNGILDLVEMQNDELKDENSNKNAIVASTQRDYMAGEVSKDLTNRVLLPSAVVKAHKAGEIHFHDSDYFAQHIFNCADGDSWIKIKHNNEIRTITINSLANEIGLQLEQFADLSQANYQILSRDGWTKLKLIASRKTQPGELLYTIKTRTGLPLKLTGGHRIPVLKPDGTEVIKEVKDLKIGDSLLDIENIGLYYEDIGANFLDLTAFDDESLDLRIANPGVLKAYLKYKYNIRFADYATKNNFQLPARARHITLKDFKKLNTEFPISFDVLSSLRIKPNHSKRDFPLFLTYTPQLAKVFAYIYADGGVYINKELSTYQLTFTNTDEALVDDFIDCYESCFGYRLNKSYPTGWSTSPCIRVTDGNKLIVALFKDFAGAKKYSANNISMPDFVCNGSKEIKLAYLAACIDTDGCLSDGAISYNSCCEQYCEQLNLVLQSLGYHPTIVAGSKAGSVYRFGTKSGIRNYDNYLVKISRNDEKARLVEEIKCFKHNDTYCYKGLTNCFNENKIIKIDTAITFNPVYDLETESHWYIINNYVSHNCCLVNLEDMLQNGTVINKTLIEKPHSFATACNIATQIIAVIASGQYGGQSVSLAHLAPFVEVSRKKIRAEVEHELYDIAEYGIANPQLIEELTEKRVREEIQRGVQTIQYQINTLNTSNGQTPFVTIFMYLNETKDPSVKKDLALIIEEVLKQRIQGTKNEKGVWITPAFPKLIYVLEEDNITENSPYWYLTELAAKCTAKRLVPDYISEKIMKKLKLSTGEISGNGDCYACMGCRSFLTPDRSQTGGFDNISNAGNYEPGKPKYYGRFNQGVVTINLVDVACSVNNLNDFWELLDSRLEICHLALQERHKRLEGTLSDISPLHWQYGGLARLQKGEKIDKLLHGGYSTISLGYAGLWECVYKLINKKLTEPEGKELGLKIMQVLNNACSKWKLTEDIDYSLYGTPIESVTYKFAQCLKDKFGIIPGVTDKNYITNSYHVHVTEDIDAFSKIALESEFQALSPGGAITYVEVPNLTNNIPAVLEVMKFIYDNIIYAELNTKSDYCQECGYDGEIKIVKDENEKLVWECPQCGNRNQDKMNVARRTCGYIGSNFWNQGRTEEILERKLHL